MRCKCAWAEARDCESLHFAFFGLLLLLQWLQLHDLGFVNRAALQARAAVQVDFEATLDVPFDALAVPAVLEAFAHFERYYLVAELHKIVKHANIGWLELAIEEVTLDHVGRVVPLRLLSQKLTFLHLGSHRVLCSTRAGVDHFGLDLLLEELIAIEAVRALKVGVIAVCWRLDDH